MRFEWNSLKAQRNLTKHGVTLEEASTAFGDPLSLTVPDPDHSVDEQRYILLGETLAGRLVVVVHVDREDTVRIISARPATRAERRTYEQ